MQLSTTWWHIKSVIALLPFSISITKSSARWSSSRPWIVLENCNDRIHYARFERLSKSGSVSS